MNKTKAGKEWTEAADDVSVLKAVQALGRKDAEVEIWASADEPLAGQAGLVLVAGDTVLGDQLVEMFPSGKLYARSAESVVVSCL